MPTRELQPVKTQNRKEDTYSKTTKEKKKKVYLATHYSFSRR
jgi:phage major head subunit gpT-like protein